MSIEKKHLVIISKKNFLLKALQSCDELKDFEFTKSDGLIIKDFKDNVLINAQELKKPLRLKNLVQVILNSFDKKEIEFFGAKFIPSQRKIIHNSIELSLTEKEVHILQYFIENKNKELDKQDMLSKVWGYDKDATTNTIETHVYRIRTKLSSIGFNDVIINTENSYSLKT